MYLKSLEIQGFKSFANKITFQFHNGITGIVGPNGSGKSNVGDAVRWVLGEQSSKQLRGSSMQDVIFSGTENRKPLGYASVSITLDNADHQLPIDYGEVTVTRRVYRSGESEYLMNGTACRLKDINELFYDTGIGKEGYSIVGQGQIDKILSGKPEERRELFDEAAGIVKFKRRKVAAQKKLEAERQNLVRVSDILSELTRQLGPLERQAEKAKEYLQKKETLKQYDIRMFLLEMERLKGQIAETEKNSRIAAEHLAEVTAAYENARTDYERAEKELEALSALIEEQKEAANQSRLLQQQLAGRAELLKEQMHTAQMNGQHMAERKATVEKEMLLRDTQIQAEEQKLLALKAQVSEASESEEDFRFESDAAQAYLSKLEQQIEDGKNTVIEIISQRSSVKGKMQRYDAMKEQFVIRKAEVSSKVLQIRSETAEYEENLAGSKQAFEEVSKRIEALLEKSAVCEAEVNEIQARLTGQNQQMEQEQAAYHRASSRLESLVNLTERYDGYGNSIRRVMEQKTKEPGIHGVVADLIQVEKSYETAIETALGGSIQNIVTDTDETAKRLIEHLKRNRYGRATFLPLTAVNKKGTFQNPAALKETGILGIAENLVHTEEKYRGLVGYLLGKTLVADTIDHAIAVERKYHHSLRIVTLEGESLSPGGSMTGGAFKNNSNLLGRRREIEELRTHTQKLQKELETLQLAIDADRRKRNAIRQQIVEYNEALQGEYLKQNTARMEMRQMEERQKESEDAFGKLKRESADLDAQMQQIEREKEMILARLSESEQMEQEKLREIEAWQAEQEQERSACEAWNAKIEAMRLELANAKQQEAFVSENMARLQTERQSLEEEKQSLILRMEQYDREAGVKQEEMEKIGEEAETAVRREADAKQSLETLLRQKEEKAGRQKGFFAQREELAEKRAALDKEGFRLQARMEKFTEERDAKINYMWDEYGCTPSEIAGQAKPETEAYGTLKKWIGELKAEIKGLGNVNVNAIEDFKEVSERHTFLSGQHADLVKAEEALLEIIQELDTGMRAQFEENFAKIKTEFDKAFKELFGGGKGTLELVEGEDILEAGIRIISQPPGKKLQNMMQLSGGEKALTAIALLFAIQHLKPSPFCLLDEIEAALDESNVARYAKYLHKLTKHTQFIIITHRRGTMAAADRLYGITMQEKGISALVSVNLIQEELDA